MSLESQLKTYLGKQKYDEAIEVAANDSLRRRKFLPLQSLAKLF